MLFNIALSVLIAHFDQLESRYESLENRLCEEAIIWQDNKRLTNYNTNIVCYMLSGTSTEKTTISTNSNSITQSSDTTISTPATQNVNSGSSSTITFNEEMYTESIIATIVFLQKAHNANALKPMTTTQKMKMRSVSETLFDTAY